ncbi:hypothetical protein U1Q18_017023, partial [Sarracenia purpurea var. burkii]
MGNRVFDLRSSVLKIKIHQCKHQIVCTLGKAKEKIDEKTSEVEEQAKEAIREALSKAKESISPKTDEIS